MVKRSMRVQGHFKVKGRVPPHSASDNLHTVFAESRKKQNKNDKLLTTDPCT